MQLQKIMLFLILISTFLVNAQGVKNSVALQDEMTLKAKGHMVILKLDDLIAGDKNMDACAKTFDYCIKNNIKAAFGVFNMGALTKSQKQRLKNWINAKNVKGEKLFEIWHHGLDHSKDNPAGTQEFKGTGYAAQKEHFEKGDRIVRDQLGIQMHTFGAPYNASDSVTGRVIAENRNYNVVLFGSSIPDKGKALINMNQRVNMESATGVVEYNCFEKEFGAKKDKFAQVMVLQGHPAQWGEKQLAELDKIVRFLQTKGYVFVLPYEYYRSTL